MTRDNWSVKFRGALAPPPPTSYTSEFLCASICVLATSCLWCRDSKIACNQGCTMGWCHFCRSILFLTRDFTGHFFTFQIFDLIKFNLVKICYIEKYVLPQKGFHPFENCRLAPSKLQKCDLMKNCLEDAIIPYYSFHKGVLSQLQRTFVI